MIIATGTYVGAQVLAYRVNRRPETNDLMALLGQHLQPPAVLRPPAEYTAASRQRNTSCRPDRNDSSPNSECKCLSFSGHKALGDTVMTHGIGLPAPSSMQS